MHLQMRKHRRNGVFGSAFQENTIAAVIKGRKLNTIIELSNPQYYSHVFTYTQTPINEYHIASFD